MQTIATIGFDIAKSVFQVHGVDAGGQVVIRRQLKRRSVLTFFQKLSPCLVGIEASDMSEDEARLLERGPALVIIRSLAADASPLEADQVGSTSRLVLDLNDEIERGLPTAGAKLVLRVDPPVLTSGLATWSLRGVIERWRRRGGTTGLSVPIGTVAALDAASIRSFRDQLTILDLELEEGEEVAFPNRSRLLAEIIPEREDSLVFASRDAAAFQVGPQWGKPQTAAIVRFRSSRRLSEGLKIARTSLQSSAVDVSPV